VPVGTVQGRGEADRQSVPQTWSGNTQTHDRRGTWGGLYVCGIQQQWQMVLGIRLCNRVSPVLVMAVFASLGYDSQDSWPVCDICKWHGVSVSPCKPKQTMTLILLNLTDVLIVLKWFVWVHACYMLRWNLLSTLVQH